MVKRRKSWQEKLADNKGLPKIVKCEEKGKLGPRWGIKSGDTLLIPAPKEVDEIISRSQNLFKCVRKHDLHDSIDLYDKSR